MKDLIANSCGLVVMLPHHLPGENEEDHRQSQSEQLTIRLAFQIGISQFRARSVTVSVRTLDCSRTDVGKDPPLMISSCAQNGKVTNHCLKHSQHHITTTDTKILIKTGHQLINLLINQTVTRARSQFMNTVFAAASRTCAYKYTGLYIYIILHNTVYIYITYA